MGSQKDWGGELLPVVEIAHRSQWMREVEAAGIEPASENVPSEHLHTCQVPIWSYPGLKEPAKPTGAPAR